jgi:hypothetical protein
MHPVSTELMTATMMTMRGVSNRFLLSQRCLTRPVSRRRRVLAENAAAQAGRLQRRVRPKQRASLLPDTEEFSRRERKARRGRTGNADANKLFSEMRLHDDDVVTFSVTPWRALRAQREILFIFVPV